MKKYQPGELRSRADFEATMAQPPYSEYLKPIPREKRKQLLRELYNICSHRKQAELAGQVVTEMLPELRANRKRMLKAAGLLGTALEAVRKARASYEFDLDDCEERAPNWDLPPFTFAGMEKDLHYSVELLKAFAAMEAACIPQKWRTSAEKRLSKKYMPAINDTPEGASEPNIVATKKALALDAWLIRKAAECIDEYTPGTDTLRGRTLIIVELFQAAFGQNGHNQSNVQKMLDRRKKPKGLLDTPGQGYVDSTAKVFFPNSKFLKQEPNADKLRHPRTSK